MLVNRYGPIIGLFPSLLVSQSTQLTRMDYLSAWHTGL
ncbi:hypothetical protein T45_08179 [Streptomyces turgidiscabies]|nr:hypothetical protein T45_08179 [Streptomyces turgidiscabies]